LLKNIFEKKIRNVSNSVPLKSSFLQKKEKKKEIHLSSILQWFLNVTMLYENYQKRL